MKIKLLFILSSIFLSVAYTVNAQHTMGKVYGMDEKDFKEPLPGAVVFWKGTKIGTSTDSTGMFHINNPDVFPASLIVSMLGFLSDTLIVTKPDEQTLEIVLNNAVTLKEVNVEAKQNPTMFSTFAQINVEIINNKELLKAACCNLSESFTTNASVDVTFTDAISGAKKIQMLGLSGIYTQVLSENMPMLRGLSSAYGLNYIPGTWIESIRVTKGTGSVVNGYESISGQINLEFLKPEAQKERLFFNVYANHKGRVEANVHYAQKINDKWSQLLFLHGSELQYKNDMNKDGFLDMPLTKQFNVFNRWNYNSNKNLQAQFGIKALSENRQGGQTNFNYKNDYGTTNAYGVGVNTNIIEYFSKTGYLFASNPYKSIGLQTSGKIQQQDMFFGLRKYNGQENNFYANLIFANIIKNSNHKEKMGTRY